MSSVEKGNKFENQVFEEISKALKENRLGFSASHCKIFQKKGYHSRDRNAAIIVDISIEIWLPDADAWSMLWVCECKDYSKAIPVDDVEEFKAKLDQIAGKNIKGVMAVTSAFQGSSFNYARSNGIGVIRILPEEQVDWLMYSMTSDMLAERLNPLKFNRAFTVPQFKAENQEFFGIADDYLFDSWTNFLTTTLGDDATASGTTQNRKW